MKEKVQFQVWWNLKKDNNIIDMKKQKTQVDIRALHLHLNWQYVLLTRLTCIIVKLTFK